MYSSYIELPGCVKFCFLKSLSPLVPGSQSETLLQTCQSPNIPDPPEPFFSVAVVPPVPGQDSGVEPRICGTPKNVPKTDSAASPDFPQGLLVAAAPCEGRSNDLSHSQRSGWRQPSPLSQSSSPRVSSGSRRWTPGHA